MDAYIDNIAVTAIGPLEAQQLIATGNCNHVDQTLVDRYASDMKRGLWVYPGGIIEITADGRLKDGHHRLLAIIQCGIPQIMIVVHNVAENIKR